MAVGRRPKSRIEKVPALFETGYSRHSRPGPVRPTAGNSSPLHIRFNIFRSRLS